MSNQAEPMTPGGHAALKERLKQLKEIEMPRLSKEIGAARELGDLSENAEYHAAKDKQGLVAAQIRHFEDKLARAEIIDPAKLSGSRAIFGATVTIEDEDSGEKIRFQIVGEDEADVKTNKISYTAPMARAVIGKEEDDVTTVMSPRGSKKYIVAKVEYPS